MARATLNPATPHELPNLSGGETESFVCRLPDGSQARISLPPDELSGSQKSTICAIFADERERSSALMPESFVCNLPSGGRAMVEIAGVSLSGQQTQVCEALANTPDTTVSPGTIFLGSAAVFLGLIYLGFSRPLKRLQQRKVH